ncbi:DUF1566 domain-containing protein [Pseudoxanthomonas indica]|uniref:Lcl C-terminal domain-containing protein n=1 Tax=Pseudoxanthomonas indica TaxID=428993 RepID=A0A1T5K1G6_9GAMM|nr:DUF1566 domain-containing protein [Pseudoxanthomonas indica]GGD45926.1 hypothetical protein GCM10007235_17390 [Pseudoxanthomonas indica]SKC57491.1 Protein of unknown function [Pseudoxanthomonas indica]
MTQLSELSVRITHRYEANGLATERTIDIETVPARFVGQPAEAAQAVATDAVAGQVVTGLRSADPALTDRFTKVLANGAHCVAGDTGTDHVAVLDNATGLMWSVESLGDADGDGIEQKACIDRCAELRLLGFDDWRLPTRAELAGLVDDTRHEPAIDTNAFPRVKPNWHWTSTPCAWSSASAWCVYFDGGSVYSGLRGGDGFALAVRRAGQ